MAGTHWRIKFVYTHDAQIVRDWVTRADSEVAALQNFTRFFTEINKIDQIIHKGIEPFEPGDKNE